MQTAGDKDSSYTKSSFFFLTRSFWGLPKRKAVKLVDGDRIAKLQQQSISEKTFLVHKLSKSYGGGATAVKEFTSTLNSGQCFVLLGPNVNLYIYKVYFIQGCGKSSLIKMLSGISSPTAGNAFLFGNSINEDVEKIYAMSGCCHQEDIIWDQLSASDHIRIFALFRGYCIIR